MYVQVIADSNPQPTLSHVTVAYVDMKGTNSMALREVSLQNQSTVLLCLFSASIFTAKHITGLGLEMLQ